MVGADLPDGGAVMLRVVWLFVVATFIVAGSFAAALYVPGGARPAYALDCGDFPYQAFAQSFLRVDPEDRDELDGADDNGIACDDLPCPCDEEPVEDAIGDDGGPEPTETPRSGTNASAGNTNANASASGPTATATSPPGSIATVAVVAPTSTPLPPVQSVITPPSTGDGGLR
jgi:hypothetical protein